MGLHEPGDVDLSPDELERFLVISPCQRLG